MSDPLNTHSYDGKIDIDQIPDLRSMKHLELEEKKNKGCELLAAAEYMNPVAITFLNYIILSMGTSANIDTTNGLVADDIICLCWI